VNNLKPTKNEDEYAPVDWLLFKIKKWLIAFRSLFKNEWTWRLFLVLQVIGIIGVTCLIFTNDDRWNLFPHQHLYADDSTWDLMNSRYWSEYHENWLAAVFLFSPFFLSKAIDWILAGRKNSSDDWKQN